VLRNERENAGRPDVERLENYVARSKKKLSKLRKKMKDAEANLESKEKLVKEKQKTALAQRTSFHFSNCFQG